MKTLFSIKNTTKFFIATAIATLLFISCKKDSSDNGGGTTNPFTPPDLTATVNSALISGFVTDENEAAVKNATVQIGTSIVNTDKYGYFEARNANVVKNAATVNVTRTGYFKSIKTFIAEAGKSAFFRIKMIPKATTGTVSGASGGAVTLSNGMGINFPAGAVVNATTNAAYTGTVNVAAYWINPTSTDLNRIMPGDLRGLNTDGNLQLLTTYGMAAVELTGTAGELLQIAAGKKAALTIPIPSALSAAAPATIPLWYFDEAKGLWKQEGSATKNGNNYVGEVSHFSFWNCDVPKNYIQFNCTVVNTAGLPLQNVKVKISPVSNPLNATYGYTDANGYVSGALPDSTQLNIEVFSSLNCNTAIFSQTFTTTNLNVNFGNITISTTANVAVITGNVTNCAGAAVTNGYVILQNGTINNRYALSATGSFSIPQILCTATPVNYTIYGEDPANAQQGNPVVYPIAVGNNAIPAIQACGTSIQQYIYTTINGVADNFIVPANRVYDTSSFANNGFIGVKASPNGNAYLDVFFTKNGTATGSTQNLLSFGNSITGGTTTIPTPIAVNITEYGTIGQYMAGNFSGVIKGAAPGFTISNITCNFRVKRVY